MPLIIPAFSLKDIGKYTREIVITVLLASNVYFINTKDDNTDLYNSRLDKVNYQKDSIAGKYFDLVFKVKQIQESSAIKDSVIITRDSLLREKTEKPALKIINTR